MKDPVWTCSRYRLAFSCAGLGKEKGGGTNLSDGKTARTTKERRCICEKRLNLLHDRIGEFSPLNLLRLALRRESRVEQRLDLAEIGVDEEVGLVAPQCSTGLRVGL